jgi:Tfp pilus assembly protein PilN
MRAVNIDYQPGAGRARVGAALLVVGALMATVALIEYRSVREAAAAWETRVAEIRKTAKRGPAVQRPARDREATAQEIKTARLALQRLSSRWSELFGALESARADGVALLAIEPDPGKNTVKLTAEARSAADMLDYVQRLQSAETLADVALTTHQTKQGDALKALRFVVVASWVNQP